MTRKIKFNFSLARAPKTLDRVFGLVAGIASVGFIAHALHSYITFGSYLDFSGIDGVFLRMLRQGEIDISYRFNPILIAILPVYAIWPVPKMLLIVQALALVAPVFPIYWFARKEIGRGLGLLMVMAYLVSPSVRVLNGAALYEIELVVPLMSFTLFFLLRRSYLPFLICLAFSAMVKQEIAFVVVGFGMFLMLNLRQRWIGIGIAGLGIALALFIILVFFPSSQGNFDYPVFGERYAYLGRSLNEVATTILTHPELVIQHVLTPRKLEFIAFLLTPLAFLPLIGWEVFMISLPAWAYTLLSDLGQQTDPGQYYQAVFVPFLAFGAITGLRRVLRRNPYAHRRRWKLVMGAILIASTQLYLPSTWTRLLDPSNFSIDKHTQVGYEILERIPTGEWSVAQSEIYMQLYERQRFQAFAFSPNTIYTQAGVATLYLIGDTTRTWYTYQKTAWEYWRATGYFETIAEKDGYFILRNRVFPEDAVKLDNGWVVYNSRTLPNEILLDTGAGLLGYDTTTNPFLLSLGVRFGDEMTLVGYRTLPGEKIRGGETARVMVDWRADRDGQERYTIVAQIADVQGHVWAEESREPAHGAIPTNRWKAGAIYRDQYTFELPRTMPPGEYRLIVNVWNPRAEKSLPVIGALGNDLGLSATLGALQVGKDTANVPANYLQIENPFYSDIAEVRLLGSTALPEKVTRGEVWPVGLYWRAREKPAGDYRVAVQLRDAKARVVFEQIDRPAAGAYPTTRWETGEVLLDWHDLAIPANLATGKYALVVVLKEGETVWGSATIGQVGIQE